MSLVERLAERFREWDGPSLPYHPDYEVARFWLRAIADELEAADPHGRLAGDPRRWHYSLSADWLREHADGAEERSK